MAKIVKTVLHDAPAPENNAEPVEVREIIAIMPSDKLTPDELSSEVKNIRVKLTDNNDMPDPFPTNIVSLTEYDLTIKELDHAILVRKSNVVGSAKLLSDAVKKTRSDTANLMSMVQNAMRIKPLEAIRICTDAGFKHKKLTARGSRPNTARPTTVAGELLVEFGGSTQMHIQISKDKGQTWTNCDPTSCASLLVQNLISDTTYYFRGRKVLKKGAYGDWSGTIEGTPL
ncbi:MAG: hypothetical protein WCL06_10215 [Bacteroidota bacterium]